MKKRFFQVFAVLTAAVLLLTACTGPGGDRSASADVEGRAEKNGAVKVSMRAKSYGRVDSIAVKYGGGGHVKAAGCTLDMPMDEALALIKSELEDYWNDI